jgi:hypothetical protein
MEGIELPLQTLGRGAKQCKVVSIEQTGHRKASKGRGCGVSGGE